MEIEAPTHRHITTDILAVFGVAAIIIILGVQFVGEVPIGRQLVVWTANIAMILTVVYMLRRRGETMAHLGVRKLDTSLKAMLKLIGASLLAFVFAVAAFVLGSIVMANITGIPESADMSSYEFLSGNPLMLALVLVGVFIASSFGEEFIYRGFLMSRFAKMMGGSKKAWMGSALISSLIFGLIHYDWGLMGMVQTAFMGMALAISWLKAKKNLWVVVLAHAYMDFILMMQMYFR